MKHEARFLDRDWRGSKRQFCCHHGRHRHLRGGRQPSKVPQSIGLPGLLNRPSATTKAGENGRIFGSVTTIQLADAIEKMGYKVNRKLMKIRGEAIKQLGTYEAEIRLTKDVSVVVKFDVEKE